VSRLHERGVKKTRLTAAIALVLAIVVTAAIGPGARAQTSSKGSAASDARHEQLALRVRQAMEKYRVPGVAVGVFYQGRTTTRGFGVTSVEDPRPITPGTVFPIASISKTFAATAIMRLVEQQKVDLRAPVQKYLPDLRLEDETVAREVTVWNLLTHSSGWEGQIAPSDRGDETLARFVKEMMPGDMQLAPPGAAWSYNNAGFTVAGRLIEVITGKPIGAALADLVFNPLQLSRTVTSPREMMTFPFAVGHTSGGTAKPTIVRPFAYSTSVTAGGVSTSIDDLLAYARFHLGAGSAAGTQILSRASLEQMRAPQLQKQGTDDEMGIGWHLRTVGGLHTAAHGGTLNGHVLLLEIVPERQFAIAILTNTSNGWRLNQEVERAALQSYLGADFKPNQAIAHRGLVETLPRVEPLDVQPALAPYLGRYVRPMVTVAVSEAGGHLVIRQEPISGGGAATSMPVTFYGPDRAVVTEGSDEGQSVEFVRRPGGTVDWIRIVGRIAKRSL
jgi:CubicO group peptidase (beta-lactamase class C family)